MCTFLACVRPWAQNPGPQETDCLFRAPCIYSWWIPTSAHCWLLSIAHLFMSTDILLPLPNYCKNRNAKTTAEDSMASLASPTAWPVFPWLLIVWSLLFQKFLLQKLPTVPFSNKPMFDHILVCILSASPVALVTLTAEPMNGRGVENRGGLVTDTKCS